MIVDSALYRGGARVPLPCDKDDLTAVREATTADGDFVWVGMYEPSGDELERVAEAFDLHPLAVEDALHAHQRPSSSATTTASSWSSRRSGTSTRRTRSRPARSTCSSAATSWSASVMERAPS